MCITCKYRRFCDQRHIISSHYIILHKRSFIVTLKVPAHMYTSFSITILYADNISSIDNPIKKHSDKVRLTLASHYYMGQYKND